MWKLETTTSIFFFNRADLLTGGATQSILINQFETEQLILELRFHDKCTSARNYGSGFRMNENGLEKYYRKVEEVEN